MTHAAAALAEPLPAGPGVRAAADPVVRAERVALRYGEGVAAVDALRGVSLSVAAGQLTAVMGASGAGKSTLLQTLAGLERPTAGRVWIAGEEITAMDDRELARLRRRHVGFVFRYFNLLPMLTAEENVALPLSTGGRTAAPGWVDGVIDRVGLTARRRHRPAQLSGGDQQRVAIARALVSEPSVLFADEPTGNLDPEAGAEILALLRRVVDDYGQTTVMVTDDVQAAALADRVLFLAGGELVMDLDDPTEGDVPAAVRALGS